MSAETTPTPRTVVEMIKVGDVNVPDERRRHADQRVVLMLAESIRRRGLMLPIRVRRDGRLVCGLHRLLAHILLGLADIEVVYVADGDSDVDIELDEIEENLCRREISTLERAVAERRRKTLYETERPETRAGVAGGLARQGQRPKHVSFARSDARDGSGVRMREQRAQIADALGTDAVRLYDRDVARSHRQLVQLARLPEEERTRAVDILAAQAARTVKDAVRLA
ncbi:MAG: ParB N-terminal domain-containing protein, partial [Polyangiales bacterium]